MLKTAPGAHSESRMRGIIKGRKTQDAIATQLDENKKRELQAARHRFMLGETEQEPQSPQPKPLDLWAEQAEERGAKVIDLFHPEPNLERQAGWKTAAEIAYELQQDKKLSKQLADKGIDIFHFRELFKRVISEIKLLSDFKQHYRLPVAESGDEEEVETFSPKLAGKIKQRIMLELKIG